MASTSLAEKNLEGLRILVTGGHGRLGPAIVKEIENQGGYAYPTSRNPETVATFNESAKRNQRLSRAVLLSFESEAELLESAEATLRDHGPFHGLVNNAHPTAISRSVEKTSWSDWEASTRIGLAAAHSLAVCLMRTHHLTSVVNISSMFAIRAPRFSTYPPDTEPNPLVYGPTKAALLSMTRYLAAYWGTQNVRVNAVSPGGIQHGQTDEFYSLYASTVPTGRMVTGTEVAAAVAFLLSDDASGITGQNIVVDAGRTIW